VSAKECIEKVLALVNSGETWGCDSMGRSYTRWYIEGNRVREELQRALKELP
jgi:hypothetical protein